MKKRVVNGIEVEASSGNVFADLGLPDADTLRVKSGLTVEIVKAIRDRGLTQAEAARRMGLKQPEVSALLRGEFSSLSERKLMDCLLRLGYDIEIRVRAFNALVGYPTTSENTPAPSCDRPILLYKYNLSMPAGCPSTVLLDVMSRNRLR